MHKISNKDTESFYDIIADEYDSMTSFEQRLMKERLLFQSVIEKYNIKTALDAGAGTGVHSILLAQSGINVTAVDISQKMLKLLRAHSKERNLNIKTVKTDFINLPNEIHKKFDAVFCMGNSLVHAKSLRELLKYLSSFYKLLNPHGSLIIQILNYDRIISKKEIIQSIKESNGKIFIRFYRFSDKHIDFHVLTIERKDGTLQHKLRTTTLRPIKQQEIVKLLRKTGFKAIKSFGNITCDKFLTDTSKDLFLFARK